MRTTGESGPWRIRLRMRRVALNCRFMLRWTVVSYGTQRCINSSTSRDTAASMRVKACDWLRL